jgi:hypothetical protein
LVADNHRQPIAPHHYQGLPTTINNPLPLIVIRANLGKILLLFGLPMTIDNPLPLIIIRANFSIYKVNTCFFTPFLTEPLCLIHQGLAQFVAVNRLLPIGVMGFGRLPSTKSLSTIQPILQSRPSAKSTILRGLNNISETPYGVCHQSPSL